MKHAIKATPHQIQLSLQFPKQSLASEAPQRLQQVQAACAQLIKANHWLPMREPQLSLIRETDSLLEMLCTIDLMPKVSLPERLPLKLEAPEIELPQEQDLLERIQAMQIRFGETRLNPAGAVWGNMLRLHWFGVCQGELIALSPRANFFMLLTQDPWASPLAKDLIGAQAGQTLIQQVILPLDHPHLPWRGQSAEYQIYVESVQTLTAPPASELAKLSGHADLEALLAQVHQELRDENQTRWRQRLQARLLMQVLKSSQLQVPEFWVTESLAAWWQGSDAEQLTQLQKDLPLASDYLTKGIQNWKQQTYLAQKVKQDLALQLILSALADKNPEALKEQEITQILNQVGTPLHMSSEQVWEALQREGQAPRFLNQIRLEKASRWLLSQSQIYQGTERLMLPV